MTIGNVLRLMEDDDTLYFPEIKEKYKEFGHHGDYFFGVIIDSQEERIGYLIAHKEGEKLLITTLYLQETIENRYEYRSAAFSNLYKYVKEIKDCEGNRRFFQVSVP